MSSITMPDSRMIGHGATLRAHTDEHWNNTVIIPDPAQTALSDSVIRSWQVFAKEVSIEHSVYLQVRYSFKYIFSCDVLHVMTFLIYYVLNIAATYINHLL